MRRILVVSTSLLALACSAGGADYFATPTGTGNAWTGGDSYADAWSIVTAFGNNRMQPGDRCIIAPGYYAPGQSLGTWSGRSGDASGDISFVGDRSGYLTAAADGVVTQSQVAADAVTSYAAGGLGSNFRGKVIIDFTGVTGEGIYLWGDSYLTFKNLELRNAGRHGFRLRYNGTSPSHHITIENCVVHSAGGGGIVFEDGTNHLTIFNCLVYNTGGSGSVGGIASWQTDVHHITITNCTVFMCNTERAIILNTNAGNNVIRNCIAFQPNGGTSPDNTYNSPYTMWENTTPPVMLGVNSGIVNSMSYNPDWRCFEMDNAEIEYWGDDTSLDGTYDPGDEIPGYVSQNIRFRHPRSWATDERPFSRAFYNDTGGALAGVDFLTFAIGTDEFFTTAGFTEDDFRLYLDSYTNRDGYGISTSATPVNGGTGEARKMGLDLLTTFNQGTDGIVAGYVLDGDAVNDYSDVALQSELDTAGTGWTDRATDAGPPASGSVVWNAAQHNVAGVGGYVDSEADYADPAVVNLGYHWLPYDSYDSSGGYWYGYSTVDADLDGMPDAWETSRSTPLDPADPTDAGLDPDVDGYTNLQEYRNDSDPHVYNAPDADADGLDDRWEQYYSPDRDADDLTITAAELDDFAGAPADYDADGMTDEAEHDQAADSASPAPYDAVANPAGTDVNPTVSDTDGDGLEDGIESDSGTYVDKTTDTGTSPVDPDTDDDGFDDAWELGLTQTAGNWGGTDGNPATPGDGDWLDPTDATDPHGATGDRDGDGYDNTFETLIGTDPTDPNSTFTDADDDTIDDTWELAWPGVTGLGDLGTDGVGSGATDTADFDSDGMLDADEYAASFAGTLVSPVDADTDDDGLADGVESDTGTFVDALTDTGTNPTETDTDADGFSDGWEATYHDAFFADTGVNGFDPTDGTETGQYTLGSDYDADGLTNAEENQHNTDPNNSDTDGDGSSDEAEVAWGTDPLDPNSTPTLAQPRSAACTPGAGAPGVLALLALAVVVCGRRR